jgi:hypothetical protein
MRILVPAKSTSDWQDLLSDPVRHWKQGYSAKSLADHWQLEGGFPADVRNIFRSATVEYITDAEMLFGVPEYETELPGGGNASQTDLFVLAKCRGGLITMSVEGKVSEPFDKITSEWFHQNEYVTNRRNRLSGLCELLGLEIDQVMDLRYQLLHRTASALIEAERFSADTAVMLVNSFSSTQESFDDYEAFGKAMGVSVESGALTDAGMHGGRRLFLGWLTSPIKES